jgi:uncharacterized protein
MSETINNREYRQQVLKEIILELHQGRDVAELQERFAKIIEGVSPSEISAMEQALISEGMPISEVQRLCDVHASVFKGTLEQIHHPDTIPGHPIHTFKAENVELEKLIGDIDKNADIFKENDNKENLLKLIEQFNLLWDIDKHYSRKENILFPFLEKYGITAPPQVMWGVDDEIRSAIKKVKASLLNYDNDKEAVVSAIKETLDKIKEMIFKEENILFPMTLETLSEDEWAKVMEDSDEIGYCLTEPQGKWEPVNINVEERQEADKLGDQSAKGYIKFETGILTAKEISAMFNSLPVDVTFIDKDNLVKYFSQSKERVFARTKAIIGRSVENCHPPGSVHIVDKIVDDLKSGRKDHEDFWIRKGDFFLLIRYFAVRDENGEYLGAMEVTQNIKPIQEITGEKRLVSD